MKPRIASAAAIIWAVGLATGAQAGNILINGDFETGNYAGWSVYTQAGSSGSVSIAPNNGGASPLSSSPYRFNLAGGRFFSITDQNGPGSYSLIQGFTLAAAAVVTIQFDMFANDQAGIVLSNGRDYTGGPNQNAVVDLLWGGVDPFTDAASDIVAILYGPGADDLNGNPNLWTRYSKTMTLGAGSYMLRFAETDNQLFFQQGVDNVSVSIPEAATWALMVGGFVMVGAALRRHRTSIAIA